MAYFLQRTAQREKSGVGFSFGDEEMTMDYVAEVFEEVRLNPAFEQGCWCSVFKDADHQSFVGVGQVFNLDWDGVEYLANVYLFNGIWNYSIPFSHMSRCFLGKQDTGMWLRNLRRAGHGSGHLVSA